MRTRNFHKDRGQGLSGSAPLRLIAPLGMAALALSLAASPALAGKKPQPSGDQQIADIPNGEPMTLVVSLGQQKVDVYRGTTLVTSNVVSTGMPGHATKPGVFSILEKQRWHHSNIYSGAPMPWMNRITWSGTALHAGVVPGYPASHGCIRLTYAFAPKLYQITTVGDNVVVAQGRPAPQLIEHPNLFQPLPLPSPPLMAKDPGSEQHTELLPSDGALGGLKSSAFQSSGPGLSLNVPKPFILAKADGALAVDAGGTAAAESTGSTTHAASDNNDGIIRVHAITPAPAENKTHAVETKAPAADNDHAMVKAQASPDQTEPSTPPVILVTAPAASPAPAQADAKPDASAPVPPAPAAAEAAPGVPAPAQQPLQATAPAAPPVPSSPTASKLDHGLKAAATEAAEPRSNAPLRILITRRTQRDRIVGVQNLLASMNYLDRQDFDGTIGKPTVAAIKAFQKANGMKETGVFNDDLVAKVYQVADQGEPPVGHLFVRQQFTRLFDAPVTFKDPDQPLGTHLFTVQKFGPDDTKAQWTAINLSGGDGAGVLDRLQIPDDLRQKISERLTPGSSLIVADLSINSASLPKGGDFVVWTKDTKVTPVSDTRSGDDERAPAHRSYRRQAPAMQPNYYERRPAWFGQW